MKLFKIFFWYGLFIWIIPFIVSINIYALRSINHALFQSLMTVVLTLCVVVAGDLYFSKIKHVSLYESMVIGLWWFLISIVLDVVVFIFGPIRMTIFEYLSEVGSSYMIIPLITMGINYMIVKRKEVK